MSTEPQLLHYTWDDWEDEFIPVQNHISAQAPFNGWMFETYGEELEYIIAFPEQNRIWTLSNDGQIINGCHLVNRSGYFITEEPAPLNSIIEVWDDDSEIYEEEDDGKSDGIFT